MRALETAFELVVADSGAGVPPNRIDRIFEPFYQVDGSATRAHGGVGVGLAVARRVARGLGGDIRVTSGAAVAGAVLPGSRLLVDGRDARADGRARHGLVVT